jgi:SAM-dependent methyltransferase
LALDLEKLDAELIRRPITNAAAFLAADELAEELRITQPLVASDSVDVVVSNCVLNLVEPRSKRQLFDEIFRVLRKGGRAVISDIVADEEVKWTPKLRPAAKLDFPRSAQNEKEQIDEAKTQTVQWRLQSQSRHGGDDRNQDDRADRARVSGASAVGDAVEKGSPRSHA